MKILKVLAAIAMALFLNACDDNKSSGASRVKGNVKILNNEAVLVGDGSFTLKGVSVSVAKYKIFVFQWLNTRFLSTVRITVRFPPVPVQFFRYITTEPSMYMSMMKSVIR